MERVQEAVAKARSKRQGTIGSSYSPEKGTTGVPMGDSSLSATVESKPGIGGVLESNRTYCSGLNYQQYETTRTVETDPGQLERNRAIAWSKEDPRVEVYRQLRSRLLMQMAKNDWNTLAVTSPTNGAGKTVTSVNLAMSIAQDPNHTVLLVDLDLQKPSVHSAFGVEIEKGLADYLQADEPIEELLFNPSMEQLVVLPGTAIPGNSSELLTSHKMKQLVRELKHQYRSRIVIFDLPPVLKNDDAFVFAPQVDATLLVVEDGVTTADELKRSQELLSQSNLVGTILNKAEY